jgi:hypothetical protein
LERVKRNWRQFPPDERNEFLKSILKR